MWMMMIEDKYPDFWRSLKPCVSIHCFTKHFTPVLGTLTSTGVNLNTTHFNMQYNKYYTLLHWPKQHWFSNNISTTTLSVLWCWDKNVVHYCHLSKINDIMKVWATALQQPPWQGVRASVLPDQGSQLHTHTIPDDTSKGSSSTIPDDASS